MCFLVSIVDKEVAADQGSEAPPPEAVQGLLALLRCHGLRRGGIRYRALLFCGVLFYGVFFVLYVLLFYIDSFTSMPCFC